MDTSDDPKKLVDMVIEIKLDRDTESGMWTGEAYATWQSDSECCVSLGGSDNPIYATRADAAVAMHALAGKWIA